MWFSVANGWVIGNRMQKCFVSDYVKYFTKFQDIDWMDNLHSKTVRKNVHGNQKNCFDYQFLQVGGRCLAGKEYLGEGNFGNWIRPVSKHRSGSISQLLLRKHPISAGDIFEITLCHLNGNPSLEPLVPDYFQALPRKHLKPGAG